MRNFIFRRIIALRRNYWFWPSAMTFGALLLGFALPALDAWLGSDWIESVGFIRATQVDGARAILTTLAGATLGVAGVAFSVTIVAVSFASSNYGPRLIGNFMGDRTNQIVLGILVATFVYCITVLSTVHAQLELSESTREAFVPQLSVFVALLLTLTAVGALIRYIHHIPESINIMNLTATLGRKLQRLVRKMLDEEDREARKDREPVHVDAWPGRPLGDVPTLCAETAGFLQQVDIESLRTFAVEKDLQIVLHRSPGDFLVEGEPIMTTRGGRDGDPFVAKEMRRFYTQGANRTDVQDVLFLSDQLVEVLARALSPGVNDPHTAMLCLDWLHAGLTAFARRSPAQPARPDDPVLYRRVTFEGMMNRSFDRMRQYVAADRTVTLHALSVLGDLASNALHQTTRDACVQQMHRLATSAKELLAESAAHADVDAELARALDRGSASPFPQHETSTP